jgi:hypothetical protein
MLTVVAVDHGGRFYRVKSEPDRITAVEAIRSIKKRDVPMARKKHIRSDEKLSLKLTASQRKLVLDEVMSLEREIEQIIRDTPAGESVMMNLGDLDDFGGYVAAEANHCDAPKKQKKLDTIFKKIQALLDKFTDEAPPNKARGVNAKDKLISDQVAKISQFASQTLVAAEQLEIKMMVLDEFFLEPAQRDVLSLIPGVTQAVKMKLAQDGSAYSVEEVANMAMALANDLPNGEARRQVAMMFLAKHLMDHLQSGISGGATAKLARKTRAKTNATGALYQFKITLLGIESPIWRRIQVQECTLDKLHEHIQTAMGWTNSHLHRFDIKGKRYGDPELLDDGFDGYECIDSTRMPISRIIKAGERLAFRYEYDFGDSWDHEILFEGCPPLDPQAKYPLCLEGERACPPEDCGGIGGYEEFLAAISDPKHEEHKSMVRWCGSRFSPEEFDPAKATKEMRTGLPDWRAMDDVF